MARVESLTTEGIADLITADRAAQDAEHSSIFARSSGLPINLTDPAYGGKVDGATDDSAAWVLAIAAANVRGCAIYVPAGTSVVNRVTYLPDLTAPSASVVGDPSASSVVRFTAAGGGFSVGNGTAYVYATKFRDLSINGNGVCAVPLRMRMSEESDFFNVTVSSAAVACIDVSNTSLLISRRLSLSSSPIGMRIGGACGYLSFNQSNFYLCPQALQFTGTQLSRLLFTDGWVESCADFFTINTPGAGSSIGEILFKDSYCTNTAAAVSVFRVIAASGVALTTCRILGSYFNLSASTAALVDTSAVANASDMHFTLTDLTVVAPMLGTGLLVRGHATQTWWTVYLACQRIQGVPANQWSGPPGIAARVDGADLNGNGTPEASVAAHVGSTYRAAGGGAGTCFYVKETGTGNTGWIAK